MTDAKTTVSDIISKRDPRDLYKQGSGPTDHFRRSDVQEMLEEAYKLGWNSAVRACVLPKELQ
ncbi:hypothetical protein ZMO02_17360 [Zymomonas mobilis subsp. pomaceae]|uniref:Uncharacterized protein n=1 Tax=Zymomonas mobilis subsp. pomaceae (strain ATCC 29192 / DSM 22645 / JCM 10191 / CCUG 17912 / NBRC 13757 / NCIMB 11200 / NRRL B-4491 / Barker I) TaxID=579138 RepID=F8EWI1_ZYMMT|nr:hypothetical protein Zymop_2040 [Zymomonas mobilis subsp. pomaceae ATCC 29192]GEB90099.1 hypothetical protein ZMO02_17360 [Zymomonas mobilis subsp. pomaceae]